MIDREPEIADERRIRFRIGINLGDVIVEEHDIFGDGVNVAARLEASPSLAASAFPGRCATKSVTNCSTPFEDRGEQSVKNIARPVRVYALRPEAVADLSVSDRPIAAPRQRRTCLRRSPS
jgi:class 3 adenylate cyclase